MKNRYKGAVTGHSLLKRKAEALTRRFREIISKINTAKRTMGQIISKASLSYAEVKYATGDIGYQVRESAKVAQVTVKARFENVSGTNLPMFDMVSLGQNGILILK